MRKNIWKICLILIIVLAASLRLPLLNEYPVDRDEFARIVPEFTFTSIIPPGIFFLTKFSASLFNYSDFGFRFPIFLFGIFGIPFIYLLGKEFFGEMTGILSAFILSLLLTHIGYSNQAKEYVPLMAFASISSVLAYRILSAPQKKIYFLYIIASILGLLFSSYFYGLVIVYQITIIALIKMFNICKGFSLKSFSSFHILALLVLGILGSILLVIVVFGQINNYFGVYIIKPDLIFLQKYWGELGYFVTQDVEFAKVTDLLFLIGLVVLPWRSKFRLGVIYVLLFLILDSLLVSTIRFRHSAFPIYYIRYHSFLLPLYLLIVTGVVEGIFHLLVKNQKREVAWVLVGLFLLFIVKRSYPIIRWYYTVPQMGATNFKDAGRYLTENLKMGDSLVRLKNFGMDHKFNHVNHYIDKKVLQSIDYSIFPERLAKNNWYVSLGPGDEDELGFSDYLYIERIKPSLRYPAPVISKLRYYGPFIKTRKLQNKKTWKIWASSGQPSVDLMVDDKSDTFWDGPQDSKSIVIDLNNIYMLNSVRPNFNQPYPQKFTLWLSEDRVIKKEMFNFRSLGLDPPNSQIFFPPTKARFIIIELKGSGIREINIWEVYEEEIAGLKREDVFEVNLPGIQVRDSQSPNGFAQFIPYKRDEDYIFFQIGNKLTLPKGKYKVSFRMKVDKINPDWKASLLPQPAYRLYEYLEPKDTSDSDILYVSMETTRGTFYNSPAYLNIHGEDFKEANKYYDFSMTFSANGKETLFIQAFNPRHRRYPANLYITYPQIERIK